MKSLAIILLAILAAVTYGILHDQITARICVEYFTIGHPPVFGTDDLTLLGLGWGVIATWWVGLILGIPLALAARVGKRPKRTARQLIRPLAVVATLAALAGVAGYLAARRGWIVLVDPLASQIPAHRHVPFLADLCTHLASYAGAFIAGIVLRVVTYRRRKHLPTTPT